MAEDSNLYSLNFQIIEVLPDEVITNNPELVQQVAEKVRERQQKRSSAEISTCSYT